MDDSPGGSKPLLAINTQNLRNYGAFADPGAEGSFLTSHGDDSASSTGTKDSDSLGASNEPWFPSVCRHLALKFRQVGRTLFQVSLTLENHGSVARDHLALERTFLAYIRTSLAISAAGVAFVQLVSFLPQGRESSSSLRRHKLFSKTLGALSILFSLSILVIAVMRFFAVQGALIKGNFPVASKLVAAMAFSFGLLIILTFSLLLAIALS